MTILDWINQILVEKKSWDSFDESDQKSFSPFIINRWLSMDEEFIEVVNYFQKYSIGTLLPKDAYKLYCDVFPKESRPAFMRYIKGKKEKKYDEFLLNIITEYYHISKLEATDYLDIFYLSKEGKEELRNILQKYGTDTQIIKKFKLEK